MTKIAIIISPNWKDYAEKHLEECLLSVAAQDSTDELKIYLIDNETSVASRDFINHLAQKHLYQKPWMLLTHQDNAGFAKGNNLAIEQALADGCDAIALFNMDGSLHPSCVSLMTEALYSADNNGAVQARMMLHDRRQVINSLGNVTHFLGFGFSDAYQSSYTSDLVESSDDHEICYPSGAAVMFRRLALEQVGLFDETFWMYNEDQDLGWRLWLNGWRTVLAREAVFFHKYSFAKSIKCFYWQDRNRLLAVFKNYHFLTIVLLLPAFIVSELGLWLAASRGGWLAQRWQVYRYFLSPSTWSYLHQSRQQSQSLRKVSDRQIVKHFGGRVLYQEIASPLVRVGNLVLNLYWQIVRKIIFW